jgi:hypothetical protein
MATHVGWQNHLWVKAESTFGTGVTPTIWLPYNSCDIRVVTEMFKANPFTGVRQRRAPNQPVKKHVQGNLSGELLARQLSTVSLAQTVVSLATNQPSGIDLDSWTMELYDPNDQKRWTGMRSNSLTLTGTAGGPVTFSHDLIGILEATTTAPSLVATTPVGKAMLMQDTTFAIDSGAYVIMAFTLTINNSLIVHHDNSIWPTVTAAGDRVWTLSFTVRKTANTYDAKRRSATVSDQTFQIVLKGDHDGTGANTYTTGTIDIDRMNFLDAVDQMNREGLTMAEVTYDIIKPSTTDNDVDLTWSTV